MEISRRARLRAAPGAQGPVSFPISRQEKGAPAGARPSEAEFGRSYFDGVGFGAGAALWLDLVWDLWCFFDLVVGVVDIDAPDFVLEVEDCVEDDDEVEVDGVGFAWVDEDVDGCCAATAIGRPNASARLTSFFMTVSPGFAMPFAP